MELNYIKVEVNNSTEINPINNTDSNNINPVIDPDNNLPVHLPIAIQIIENDSTSVAIPIDNIQSPEILASILYGNNRCECYKYCMVIPLGLLSIILILYYAI
jgi:hypothetical protein